MKIIKDRVNSKGVRTVTVEISKDASLLAFNSNKMYALGDPLNDVVHGGIIATAKPVEWCVVSQKWVE